MTNNLPIVIRMAELIAVTGLARSTLFDIQNPKSPRYDATFPQKLKLGLRAVGYFLEDVLSWLKSRKVGAVQPKGVIK